MSELESHDLVDIQDYRGEVYIKSEADKYINLLKDKANYNEYAYKNKSEELADSCRFYEDELRHNKHKRCLAMAMWCETQFAYYIASAKRYDIKYVNRKCGHFYRWKYRWLELAEKFKPNKSTVQ